MMRIRTVKPDFFQHGDLYDAEVDSGLPLRLAFAGLWCAADKSGRFKWRPRELKLGILPHDSVDFSRVLDALTTRGFVVKYRVDGADYGCIPTFNRHQVINNREKPSELPEPNETNILTREPRDDDASVTRDPRGESGREGKGREGKDIPTTSGADAPPADAASDPAGDGDLKRVVFNQGLDYLAKATSRKRDSFRPIVGKWVKDHGEAVVIDAIAASQREGAIEPIAFIEKALRARAGPEIGAWKPRFPGDMPPG
jgi:hypothetical protein